MEKRAANTEEAWEADFHCYHIIIVKFPISKKNTRHSKKKYDSYK